MNLKTQKRLAAKILKAGVSRVRVSSDEEVGEALTREDVRKLIVKGKIWKIQKKGTSRRKANYIARQKKKGRRRGEGSKKGSTRGKSKRVWIERIRALRKLLRKFRDEGKIERSDYRKLYLWSKGNAFRSKRHLIFFMKERGIFKEAAHEEKKR